MAIKNYTRAQVKQFAHKRREKIRQQEQEVMRQAMLEQAREEQKAFQVAIEANKSSTEEPKSVSVPAGPLMKYKFPKVLGEWATLSRVLNGCSLSRYGDGEIKHMDGTRNVSQHQSDSLTNAMKAVFRSRIRNHLVAIPNVYSGRSFLDVNEQYIYNMQRRFMKVADLHYSYGSAYITRGDLCGYISWPSYWATISELWNGRDVVLVRGVEKRANPINMMAKARNLVRVEIPPQHAWKHYKEILRECMAYPKESAYLLCAGPTATILAAELAMNGRWAVDLGHLGMFYRCWGRKVDIC